MICKLKLFVMRIVDKFDPKFNFLSSVLRDINNFPPWVDFTKLFCQAKSCCNTPFGKEIAVQFH